MLAGADGPCVPGSWVYWLGGTKPEGGGPAQAQHTPLRLILTPPTDKQALRETGSRRCHRPHQCKLQAEDPTQVLPY